MNQPWIPLSRIEELLQLEPALVILGLAVGSWIFYKLFLRGISEERHGRMREHFKNLAFHLLISALFFGSYLVLQQSQEVLLNYPVAERILPYIGLVSLITGAVFSVKVLRIIAFEYLYLSHMKVPFPLLLIDIFTLLLTMMLGGWIATTVFNIRLAPLLATSAIFSLVLGLALQDTLGNIFAGLALQLDPPYAIGDWIEITIGPQKWVGQVQEISWRATVLVGLSDESITVPNRVMGQTQISNFSTKRHPIARSHLFRIPYDAPMDEVKKTLSLAALAVAGVKKHPTPSVLISETADSWIAVKLVYFVDDYGSQWGITDRVLNAALNALQKSGIELASNRMTVVTEPASSELQPAS